MKLIENTLRLGVQTPFELIHISDTHLTYADARDEDGGRKVALGQHRACIFPNAQQNLDDATKLSRETGALLVHTGDLIDFVSVANLEAAARFTAENDCFLAAGNHEFSLYVGEAKEDAAYREKSRARVQACFRNNIRFASRVVSGVNLIAVDNSYYLLEPWQLEALKKEAARGLPIVLLLHTPLYEAALYETALRIHNGGPAYLMSVPKEKMRSYSPDRYAQQKEDAVTHEAYEYILSEPRIRAVLAGHIHHDVEAQLPNGVPQLITGLGTARRIRII